MTVIETAQQIIYKKTLRKVSILIMLTIPTVTAAINPTINGLYPIDFNSFRLIDIPTAAIAIVRNNVAKILI